MNKQELEQRTKTFAVQTIHVANQLRKCPASSVVTYQLIKSSTSVGANYREANRAESRADFIHKIGLAEKESSETCYWLEILQQLELGPTNTVVPLLGEAQELLKIFTSIGRTTKARTR